GFSLGHNQMRPRSRGSIHINSSDPHRAPEIRANYLDDPFDRRTNIRALRVMRTIAAQPALARYIVRERRPGTEILNDEEILDYCRSVGHTSYHPAGTCKMGVDERAVVDPLLRVRGVERLRVVDASVMPVLTSCNTNIPTIMIAEKAADLILNAEQASRLSPPLTV